ncbi:MAG: aspartate kinase [Candidatus Limivicinus sp.]
MLIVEKFGGSSLADTERLRRAAGICRDARSREQDVIVVVSAMGDTTDHLLDMAQEISPRPAKRELDALMTTGEQQSAALMAIMLESLGVKAQSFSGWQAGILTGPQHGGSDIRLIAPGRLQEALSRGRVPVVTGYQGFTPQGDISTLGRGGSDTTAVALAAALDADRCEIYTDVDGIYTADPRLIASARKLPRIDLRDMLALARSGSQVLHSKSVELALMSNIDIHLLSSFENAPASLVCRLKDGERPAFAGVTRRREEGSLSLAGKAADASALSRMVVLLSEAGIPVRSGRLEEGRVSVQVDPQRLDAAMQLIHDEMVLKQ